MYLYIFEDGEICQSTRAPTDHDNMSIDDGILQVLTVDSPRPFIEFAAGAGARVVEVADRIIGFDDLEFTMPPTSDESLLTLGWRRA